MRSPADNPAFMNPELSDVACYPGVNEVPNFDHELDATVDDTEKPSAGIINRHREIARLSASGRTSNEIAAHLGYTAGRISILLKTQFIQDEIARYRDKLFDQTIADSLKAAGPDAIAYIHKTITDPTEKAEIRSTNARWTVEKLTGKAKQEVAVEHNFNYYMDILRDMQSTGEVLDVTPKQIASPATSAAEASENPARWDAWIETNLG